MHNPPECLYPIDGRVDDFPLNTIFYLVARPGGTVVIKIIVTIYSVFRKIILFQQLQQLQFLRLPQIQHLLINRGSSQCIFRFKIRIRHNAQLIICLSLYETINKIRSIETEHPIIKNQIDPTREILVTNCSVSEKFIDFISRCTSQQTELNAVRPKRFYHTLPARFHSLYRQNSTHHTQNPQKKDKFPFHNSYNHLSSIRKPTFQSLNNS